MNTGEKLFYLLTHSTAVTTIISDRCYPVIMPLQPQFPLVTYSRVATAPNITQEGPSGLDVVLVQVSCWAESFDQVRQLAEAVKQAITTWGIAFGEAAYVTGDMDLWDTTSDVFHTPLTVEIGATNG